MVLVCLDRISHFATADEFTDTTLRVITIEKRQYGGYICKAVNKLGQHESRVELFGEYAACSLLHSSWLDIYYFGFLAFCDYFAWRPYQWCMSMFVSLEFAETIIPVCPPACDQARFSAAEASAAVNCMTILFMACLAYLWRP
jgi:hypothetical protein